MVKFFISKEVSENAIASIEAGKHDGEKHFDHHGQFNNNPAPCNWAGPINPLKEGNVFITHLDADTFIGILRLMGAGLPNVNFSLMEKIDLNGSSVCEDLYDDTLLYMVGIGQWCRNNEFPRCPAEGSVEVTELIEKLMKVPSEELIQLGKDAQDKVENTYKNCHKLTCLSDKLGAWAIDKDNPFDPSRPYRDGYEVVIVYRKHFQSISIYVNPKSEFEFAGKTLGGILFAGHPKACGSPRGEEIHEAKLKSVFDDVCEMVYYTE